MQRESFVVHRFAMPVFACALVLVGALVLHGSARADVDVHLDIGNAPPPPAVSFHAAPHRIYDRRSHVYVVDDPGTSDYDTFQYGGYYWLFNDGYWYRSRTWRGGFQVVQPRYVPAQIYSVPTTRWKHHPNGNPWHGGRGRGHMDNSQR